MDAKHLYEMRNSSGLKGVLTRIIVFVYRKVRLPAFFRQSLCRTKIWNEYKAGSGGRVLALGSNSPPEYFREIRARELIQIDIKKFEFVDMVVDAEILSEHFEEASFDLVLSTSMLEHTPRPDSVFCEVNKVLKPGGLFFVEVPWIYPLHAEPYDYWRFSMYGLESLASRSGFDVLSTGTVASPHGALYLFLKAYFSEVLSFGSSILYYGLDYIFSFILWPLGLLEFILRLKSSRTTFRTDALIYVMLRKS